MNLCLFCKKIDLYMDHLGSYLLPLFCYQKKKKIRTALPGHFGLSVRSLLTIWKENRAETSGLLYIYIQELPFISLQDYCIKTSRGLISQEVGTFILEESMSPDYQHFQRKSQGMEGVWLAHQLSRREWDCHCGKRRKVPQGPPTAKAFFFFFEMLSVLPGFDFERNYSRSTCSILG